MEQHAANALDASQNASQESYPPNGGLLIADYPGDATIQAMLDASSTGLCCRVFAQEERCIVLGRGCHVESDLRLDAIAEDQIKLYRRQGGGGTVVLSEGMLILAIAAKLRDPFGNKRYFSLIQQPIQEALNALSLDEIHQRGISDIAHQGRKLLGSSLRRQRELLVYQAVLLVDAPRHLFARYLKHPPREPDYRQGREHLDFTVNLTELGLTLPPDALRLHLQTYLEERLPLLLADDLLF
jgi:lipoate-protein ligase A